MRLPLRSAGRARARRRRRPSAACARKGVQPHPQHRVGVAEDRRSAPDIVRTHVRDHRQRRAQAAARRQRPLGRPLDHRAVGERIRERHADFEHVGAGAIERLQDLGRARQVGIAGGRVGDEARRASRRRSRAKVSAQTVARSCSHPLAPSPQALLHRVHVLVAAARQVHQHDRRRPELVREPHAHTRSRAPTRAPAGCLRAAPASETPRAPPRRRRRRTRPGRARAATRAPGRRPRSRGRPKSNASARCCRHRPAARTCACPAGRRRCRRRTARRDGRARSARRRPRRRSAARSRRR